MPKERIEPASNFDDSGNIVSGAGAGVGKTFIKKYFPQARHIIRIASAYFRLTGYKLARDEISRDVRLHVLVGRSEVFYVKETVIKEITSDFGQCEIELYETVKDLVERIKRGDFVIRDARAMRTDFHCKFYICDNKLLWHGSANFTYSGLRTNAEQASLIRDKRQIESFAKWYDAVSQNALDVLDELLTELEKWLALATPFEIYLKTLFLLNNLPFEPLGEGAHLPMDFQKGVIAQSLRQIEDYGGSLVVAATGLGKTVIGAEIALRLRKPGVVKRVLVVAPQIVHQNWKKELKGRDVNFEIFNSDVLFLPESEADHHKVKKLDDELRRADVDTLIVIDEAHVFRNELLAENTKKRRSRVYTRLVEVVKAGAKIVLLTATAYGTNAQNLNSLLFLLPHRNKRNSLHKSNLPIRRAWEASTPEEFAELPVVTVLGLPHVLKMARERGDIDETGRIFIRFVENQNYYLPKTLALRSVRYDLPELTELQAAFDAGCFEQARKKAYPFYDDDKEKILRGLVDTIYNTSLFGWLGSPLSIKDAIEKNLATPDNLKTGSEANSVLNNFEQLKFFPNRRKAK